jgi:hypothetical protein
VWYAIVRTLRSVWYCLKISSSHHMWSHALKSSKLVEPPLHLWRDSLQVNPQLWDKLLLAGDKLCVSNTFLALRNQITAQTSFLACCYIQVAIFSWPAHIISNRWRVNQHAVLPAMISKSLLHTHNKWRSFSCKIICHVNLLSDSPSCSTPDSSSAIVF